MYSSLLFLANSHSVYSLPKMFLIALWLWKIISHPSSSLQNISFRLEEFFSTYLLGIAAKLVT